MEASPNDGGLCSQAIRICSSKVEGHRGNQPKVIFAQLSYPDKAQKWKNHNAF